MQTDAVLGAQAKEYETYSIYDEDYFAQCNNEMRCFREFYLLEGVILAYIHIRRNHKLCMTPHER